MWTANTASIEMTKNKTGALVGYPYTLLMLGILCKTQTMRKKKLAALIQLSFTNLGKNITRKYFDVTTMFEQVSKAELTGHSLKHFS